MGGGRGRGRGSIGFGLQLLRAGAAARIWGEKRWRSKRVGGGEGGVAGPLDLGFNCLEQEQQQEYGVRKGGDLRGWAGAREGSRVHWI